MRKLWDIPLRDLRTKELESSGAAFVGLVIPMVSKVDQ